MTKAEAALGEQRYTGGDMEHAEKLGCAVIIPGEPLPKERPRFTRGRAYRVDGPAEKAVAWHMAQVFGNRRLRGNLAVHAAFFRSSKRRVDIDNLLKLVLDAANGVVWTDDSQVKFLIARLEYDKLNPRTVLNIEEMTT